jgi:hypothetical protein
MDGVEASGAIGRSVDVLARDQNGFLGGLSGRLALAPDSGLKPARPKERTHDLLRRPSKEIDGSNAPDLPANSRLLRVELHGRFAVGRVSVRRHANAPADCTHEKTFKRRPFRERLKGFEPSTFCMASRPCGPDSVRKVAGNSRVSTCGRGVGFPGFPRETTGVWAPNGHPDAAASWRSRRDRCGRCPAIR